MKRRTIARLGLGLAVAATLAVSGCAGTSDSTSSGEGKPPAGSAKDPAAALAQAAARLGEESFKMTMKMGATGQMTGVMDPKKKLAEFKMNASSEGTTVSSEMRMVGGDTYIKMDMPGLGIPGMDGKKWRRVGQSGSTGPMSLSSFDAAKIGKTLEQAAGVERVGDKGFKGTIDLAKSADALGMPAADLGKLGAKTIPFEATVDDEGRLVRYKFDTPSVGSQPSQTMDITYSDFGTPVDVTAPPAAEIAEAPTR